MRVFKFGGSSLSDAERFLRAADIIASNAKQGEVAVVLSAPGKVTNNLVAVIESAVTTGSATQQISTLETVFSDLFKGLKTLEPGFDQQTLTAKLATTIEQLQQYVHGIRLLGLCPDNVYAKVISKGERLSIATMQSLLEAKGQPASLIDPVQYLYAEGDYLEAHVDIEISTQHFRNNPLPAGHVCIMPGFTAGNAQGELVTLGRNGSDYSAAVLAACLRADCCEIWTDVMVFIAVIRV